VSHTTNIGIVHQGPEEECEWCIPRLRIKERTMTKPPAFCPYIYRDSQNLYLEFEKMTLKFAFCDAGLHKALAHIPDITTAPGYSVMHVGNITNRTTRPKLPKTKLRKGIAISDEQAAVLDELLKEIK
jgi:hypothetical protein